MFVRPGQKERFVAALALITRNRVRRNRAVGVANVQARARIIDWRGDVKSLAFVHVGFLPKIRSKIKTHTAPCKDGTRKQPCAEKPPYFPKDAGA
ncbi:hypothetical protein SDC9_145676 [bioreactor metagenome]|uniref:Uncharacterized protein n=1 Tax=bioreactor metagenome TaxID=1076179 RepID=A0A645EBJ2_9ZZZZ